jgi:hypothetical protein
MIDADIVGHDATCQRPQTGHACVPTLLPFGRNDTFSFGGTKQNAEFKSAGCRKVRFPVKVANRLVNYIRPRSQPPDKSLPQAATESGPSWQPHRVTCA